MRVHEVKFHLDFAKNAFSRGIFSLKQNEPNEWASIITFMWIDLFYYYIETFAE